MEWSWNPRWKSTESECKELFLASQSSVAPCVHSSDDATWCFFHAKFWSQEASHLQVHYSLRRLYWLFRALFNSIWILGPVWCSFVQWRQMECWQELYREAICRVLHLELFPSTKRGYPSLHYLSPGYEFWIIFSVSLFLVFWLVTFLATVTQTEATQGREVFIWAHSLEGIVHYGRNACRGRGVARSAVSLWCGLFTSGRSGNRTL